MTYHPNGMHKRSTWHPDVLEDMANHYLKGSYVPKGGGKGSKGVTKGGGQGSNAKGNDGNTGKGNRQRLRILRP